LKTTTPYQIDFYLAGLFITYVLPFSSPFIIAYTHVIAKIQQRIEEEKYEDMDDLERDFMVLCKNTQHYNEEGSLIFEDSIVLQSVFTNARERLEQEPDELEVEDVGEAIDDEGSRSYKKRKKKKKQPVYDSEEED